MRERLDSFWAKDGTKTVLASLVSIVIGLLVGCIVIVVVGLTSDNLSPKSAWEGVRIVLGSIFSTGRGEGGVLTFGFNPVNTGNMLFRATPLIMTGLSVGMAYKKGLSMATEKKQSFLGGAAAGAIWGCIPGLVKAYLNINEVLASIMTNWIAANAVTWAFEVSNFKNVVENTKTNYIYKTTFNGVETAKMGLDKLFPGSQVNGGIVVAIIIAILMYILINKTTLGYQLKACGSNRHAARYAGIKDKRNIVLSMAIAGALSGAGAALYYLSGNTEFYWQTYQSLPATGFNGIPVALLAANNPVGVIFTGIFMSMLDISGQQLTSLTPYNEYLTDVIIAVIVYLSAFSLVIKMLFTGRKKRKAAEAAPAEPEPAVTAAETPAVEAAAVPDAPPEDECSGKGGGEA